MSNEKASSAYRSLLQHKQIFYLLPSESTLPRVRACSHCPPSPDTPLVKVAKKKFRRSVPQPNIKAAKTHEKADWKRYCAKVVNEDILNVLCYHR